MTEGMLALIKHRLKQAEVTKKNVDEILPEAINFVNKIKKHLLTEK